VKVLEGGVLGVGAQLFQINGILLELQERLLKLLSLKLGGIW